MEVDEAVVDLSISSSGRPTAPTSAGFHPSYPTISPPYQHLVAARRILRPRIEPRSYVEAHEAPFLLNGNGGGVGVRTNGNADYTSSDESELGGEMPPLSAIKEFSPTELKHRERGLRRLREELRAEEMKLVLLKKLKQSQQLKENVAVLPPGVPASALPPAGLPSGLSITPTVVKTTVKQQPPPAAHSRHGNTVAPHHKPGGLPLPGNVQQPAGSANLMRAQPPPVRTNHHAPSPLSASPLNNRTSLSVPQPPQRSSMGRPPSGFPPGVKDLSPSVTITPAPPQSVKERPREDNQTPAQRQAAAKLALRKQLEKTLLQIPPPKPPPPEMHFIPNPSNTEFIYLVGLEHVVDFLTKETKMPIPPQPFACSQCQSDFTPVWKWESAKKNKGVKSVICEQCVTNNVKKALKAEHTNRLKTAFVKALQQEQEIEQRLAQNGVFTSSSPAPSPVTPEALPKSVTPTPRHAAATPPAPTPPLAQLTPPPPLPPSVSRGGGGHSTGSHSTGGHSSSGHSTGGHSSTGHVSAGSHPSSGAHSSAGGHSSSGHSSAGGHSSVGGHSSTGGHSSANVHTSSSAGGGGGPSAAAAQAAAAAAAQDKYAQQQQQQHSAAAMQAIHQQLLRTLTAGAPPAAAAHMLQFSPLFYPYQLAMAQAAAAQAAAASGGGAGGKGSAPTGPNLAELQRAADQRQYLLDMIPPGPQQRHNWKT